MTWCDKLASQPTIGLRLDPHYAGNESILTNIAPLLASWGTPEKPEFSISVPDLFRLDIQRENGFLYTFDAINAIVQFQHRIQYRAVSGGLPVAELISSPAVFTSLLEEATGMLVEGALLLPNASQRHFERIGVISTTTVSEEDLPPGIQNFISFLGKPWGGMFEGFNLQITATLKEDEHFRERCIHHIVKPEGEEALLTIKLDWQRFFKKRPPLTRRELDRACASAKQSSLEYFEELAVGDAFDEIIGKIQ